MFTTNNPFHYPSKLFAANPIHHTPFIEINKTLEDIRASKNALSSTLFVLEQDSCIRPVECDEAVNIVNDIKRVVSKTTKSIKSRASLQTPNIAYYKLLVHLYTANDKSGKLNNLMGQFRSICTETTTEQRKVLDNVKKEISSIVWICEKIENETENILDAMLLQAH